MIPRSFLRDPAVAFGLRLVRLPVFDPSPKIQGRWGGDTLAVACWALLIFALTNPFYFILTGQDPVQEVARNVATMRRAENSQMWLYVLRFGVPVLGVMLAVAAGRMRSLVRCMAGLAPIVPFWFWAMLSFTWSDSPQSTLNGAAGLLPLLISAAALYASLGPAQACRAIAWSGAVMALACIAFALFVPEQGVHQRADAMQSVHAGLWRGVYIHKNHMGQLAGLYLAAMFFAGNGIVGSRLMRLAMIALQCVLIVMSGSASALVIPVLAILAVLVVVVLSPMQRLFATLFIGLGGVFITLSRNLVLEMLGRDTTFSGRTIIWDMAGDAVSKHPLLGFGYMSPGYGNFIYELSRRANVFDPHNLYLDLLLALGTVGLALFLLTVFFALGSVRTLYKAGGPSGAAGQFLAAIVLAWLVSGLTESNARALAHVAALGYFACAALLVTRFYPGLALVARGASGLAFRKGITNALPATGGRLIAGGAPAASSAASREGG